LTSAVAHNTAVLIFASQSARDVVKKRMPQAHQLFDTFTSQTIDLVKRAGLSYVLHQDKDQKGTSFGSKFEHAIQSVFDQGYERVITIGNDTPGLCVTHIKKALSNFEQNKVTLGPSKDGGFYLLGIDDSAFAKARTSTTSDSGFRNLSWQKKSLLEAFVTQLKSYGCNITLLESLQDIDGVQDVKKILEHSDKLNVHIILSLREFFISESQAVIMRTIQVQEVYKKIFLNKGSPLAA
jgi:hypothetical protein